MVSARTTADVTPLGVFEVLRPQLVALPADWPASVSYRIHGEAESSAETCGATAQALVIAAELIFAVLVLLFGSFRQPLIIMTMAPLSMIGVFAGFVALAIPISFPAMIDVIALLGIIVNVSIVIVLVTTGHLDAGMSLREAAARGAADRMRPIFTTLITTIVGLTPLALSSPSWYLLCMAIILGLGVGTVLALILPSLYILLTPGRPMGPTALEAAF